jgi:two-component system osmolarity sensor histidine kinase EnvZ
MVAGGAMIFKRVLPRTLFGRAILILVIPVMLLQLVLGLTFVQRHYDGVSQQMAAGVASEFNVIIGLVEETETPEQARARLETLALPFGTTYTLLGGTTIGREDLRRFYDIAGGAVEEALKASVRRPITVDLLSSDRFINAEVQTDKGVLRISIDRNRVIPRNPHQLLVWTGITSILLMLIAVLFLRNQVRPLIRLADVAEAFGKGRSLPLEPRGAAEVRRAAAAFIAMRDRIERQIEQRTRVLSGVSHDLRTPLTRMKLALAMSEEGEETDALEADVREMEQMIDSYLAFARDEAGEEPVDVAVADALGEIAASFEKTLPTLRLDVAALPPSLIVPMRPGALRRALGNLLHNAAGFADVVALTATVSGSALHLIVDDDGPGIPPDRREAALSPFVRLDDARNQDRGGGVGLGLSIAADFARQHGGRLRLEESPTLGGLRARVVLPI